MAGYIGSKTVNLSTTGADIAGDADVSGALDVGGAFTSQGIDDNATSTAMTLDATGNVGIGTSSPSVDLHIVDDVVTLSLESDNSNAQKWNLLSTYTNTGGSYGAFIIEDEAGSDWLRFDEGNGSPFSQFLVNGTEAMRIDSSGNLLVGRTSTSGNDAGVEARADGQIVGTRDGNRVAYLNRKTSDGEIVQFAKDGTTVGSIGTLVSDLTIGDGDTGLRFASGADAILPHNMATNANRDNAVDLGFSTVRFDDIYATNGTIQTSDRNEKQDIAELDEAEKRVAVACKGLIRKYRWKDAVAEKGDDARIHFGIIAQDLQDAFAAEGLDAGRYAMFISSTWWETQTEVPAVEAVAEVLDNDGNVVTEAVDAVDAYTRTDTYDTQEEAPEGATERTRLGVRYSELLAFIIGAL